MHCFVVCGEVLGPHSKSNRKPCKVQADQCSHDEEMEPEELTSEEGCKSVEMPHNETNRSLG